MDALGSIKPIVSAPVSVKASTVLPSNAQPQALPDLQSSSSSGEVNFDAKAAEAKRQDVLVNAARSAPQPLGSQVFTMFKDTTGQIVTRYRDQNSGKVTYIPEPELLRKASTANAQMLVNIKV